MNVKAGTGRCVLWLAAFETPLLQPWLDAQLASFTASEHARLARIGKPLRREQFVVGHMMARCALRQLGVVTPTIEVGSAGQPLVSLTDPSLSDHSSSDRSLFDDSVSLRWHLSLAHSGTRVAAALANTAVGVDIEVHRLLRDVVGIAAQLGVSSPALSSSALSSDSAADSRTDLHEAALRAWVAAEAKVKAGADVTATTYSCGWHGCWVAVVGGTDHPETFTFDPVLGTYNSLPLSWAAH